MLLDFISHIASQLFSFLNVYRYDSECLYGIWYSLSNTVSSLMYSLLISENGVIAVLTQISSMQLCDHEEMA